MAKYLLIFLFLCGLYSTDSVWVNCFQGKVFYRYTKSSEWKLVVNKEKIDIESEILSEKGALFVINEDLRSFDFDNEHYFFLKYLFVEKKEDLILELTKLDVSFLRSPHEKIKQKKIGKTYGYSGTNKTYDQLGKRERSIMHFLFMGYLHAALLEEKRLLMLNPSFFEKQIHLDNLIFLYRKVNLKGFLLDDLRYLSSHLSQDDLLKTVKTKLDSLKNHSL